MTKTVSQIRAEAIERSQAFAAVLDGRLALADARKRLTAIEAGIVARPRKSTETRDRLLDHIAALEAELSAAESWCREINPDQLRDHDAKVAAEERAAKAVREAQEAAAEIARQEARVRSEAAALARVAARKRQRAEAIQ